MVAPFLNSVHSYVSNMYFLSFLINLEIAASLVLNCFILFPALICQLSLGPHAVTHDVLYLSLKHKRRLESTKLYLTRVQFIKKI